MSSLLLKTNILQPATNKVTSYKGNKILDEMMKV